MEHAYAVIMAGGVGSRFWPASRAARPKQLLDLTGDGRPLVAATLDRLGTEMPPDRVIVVTAASTAEAVRAALPEVPPRNVLAEPVGRNTAPCIGWAALHAVARDPEAVLAVLPADHLVEDIAAFAGALRVALDHASSGAIVTIGVSPTRPETGFGYIEMGHEVAPGVRAVLRFVEKPDAETARGYVASGRFAWNSGMFFFRATRILEEIERHMPELHAGLEEVRRVVATTGEAAAVERVYPSLPAQSIDYGVMEKARGLLVVPTSMGWCDAGSWEAAWRVSRQDDLGNVAPADAVLMGSSGCLIRAGRGKLVAVVGARDLIVVDTPDALLVCRRDESQRVKDVVEELRRRGRDDVL